MFFWLQTIGKNRPFLSEVATQPVNLSHLARRLVDEAHAKSEVSVFNWWIRFTSRKWLKKGTKSTTIGTLFYAIPEYFVDDVDVIHLMLLVHVLFGIWLCMIGVLYNSILLKYA